MATGAVETWVNVDTLGPIYPFLGSEGILAIVGIAFWIIWHIIQIREEKQEFADDIQKIKQKGGVAKVLENEGRRERSDMVGGSSG